MNTKQTTEKEGRRLNSTYPKVAVQWLNQALCYDQSLYLIDSVVLRHRHLQVGVKRWRHKMNQRIQILIILCLFPLTVFATGQAGDVLIFKGDTLILFSNPLEQYLDKQPERTFNGKELKWLSTDCYRGYLATWEVANDSLFLISVQKGCNSVTPEYFDLKAEFGSERVFVEWFTGKTLAPKGKLFHYNHSGYDSFFEKELVLTFTHGLLVEQIEHDNSKSYKSVFTVNLDSLQSFIYTNINWSEIPDLKDESKKVFISIQSSETLKPDSIQIIRGSDNELLNKEAIRVLELLPEWDIYYRQGEVYRMKWSIPIVFNEEKRRKYAQ